jgi:hypothetical protein
MTKAEKDAILDTYNACLVLLEHHAGICTDAASLRHDLGESIRVRIAEVEAEKVKGAKDG